MERKITIEEEGVYTEDYQNKMLEENQIQGLLQMSGRGMDDKSCYDYDVSGKVSVKALYEKHPISGDEIKLLLKCILNVVNEVQRYLLDVNCILLNPEYIFYESERYYFCYYPPGNESLWAGFHHLSEYLVKCADYQDQECVRIVFLLHKETMKENYSMEQIIRECMKDEEDAEDRYLAVKEPGQKINGLKISGQEISVPKPAKDSEYQGEIQDTENRTGGEIFFDREEHDWIASQEMGSTILRETDNLWTPVKRFLHRRRKPKWGDWDGLYIEEEDL